MDLTLNIKVYHTKKLFEVNLHDIKKIQTRFQKKTEVPFSRYLTPNMAMSSFFKISLTTFQYVIVYFITTFGLTLYGGFLPISEISRT